MRETKRKKNDELIKSGNGLENPWNPSEKVRETILKRIYGQDKFLVWSGREME